ncbi:MAG: DUF1003 domain-containing protein, partial [Actinomycetota bacterium]
AQNRQERRDRVTAENDREVAERTQNDTEFLAREIASVRVSLSDMITGHDFEEQVERVTDVVGRLGERIEALSDRLDGIDRLPDAEASPQPDD